MRPLLSAALLASCAAIAVTGCAAKAAPPEALSATKAPLSSPGPMLAPTTPTTPTTSPSSVSPRQRAEADAAAILASFVPPPGALRLSAAPGAAGGALRQPVQAPGSPNLVDDVSWWQAPGQPVAVLAWEKAHVPKRFASAGSSESTLHGVVTEWSDEFSLPDIPAVLNWRQLVVAVVNAGNGQTAIRVDAQVTWLSPKPAAERVPAGAQSVTIRQVASIPAGKLPAPVTVTNRAKVRRIEALADALPVFPPGMFSCPADFGRSVELTFRGAHGRTLAVVTADASGCGTVSFVVGGKSLPTLWDGATFVQQVLKVAGLHWSSPQAAAGLPG
jgi:hypothetical protein